MTAAVRAAARTAGAVLRHALAAGAPLALLLVAAGLWWAATGDVGVLRAVGSVAQLFAFAVAAPFALHEAAHAAALAWGRSPDALQVEARLLRVSVRPTGPLTAGRALVTACAGPCATAAGGVVLIVAGAPGVIGVLWLAHLLMLVPPFGDGASAVTAVRVASRARRAVQAP
ncbi:hypothetical protein MHY20_05615 [Helcobacillus sp. ACRRO]|uniref:hypothetical protein n=1 Tax=Helcobacillus TaxID=1161125 RepID=UPI001EF4AEF3|nr:MULTISPECIES: hypothetical protein [Helcobacillus]MCG7427094.1 hypothetical protein [Helcobacillus sp. ACRRO]WOO93393.1 hypothetical protein R3I40_02000 [Helcobacillus massiliensis]